MFKWLFGSNKKEKQAPSKKKINQDPEWYKIEFPYQATIFNIQRANKSHSSCCEIAIRYIENNRYKDIVKLVKPNTKTFSFSSYHGITLEDVNDAPSFPDIWNEVKPYFTNKNVVTYYADAHLLSLQSSLNKYHIDQPDFNFIDLYDYFCKHHSSWSSLSLDSVSGHLDIGEPNPRRPSQTLDTINDIMELIYEKHPNRIDKLFKIKSK